MTTSEKIKSVQAQMPDESLAEVKRIVKEVNWLSKWDSVLKKMYQQYLAETKDTISEMEFKMWMLNQSPRFPAEWERNQTRNN